MAKKEFGKYYLGLDIGTDSVGWAVTDQEYNLMKFNGKQMWGVHLFDEGNPAAARRTFRTARRRSGRKKQRLALLRELFSEEIAAIDPGFYLRLQESMFTKDDKTVPQTNSLFANPDFRDRDYHREYPTIYHLRRALLEDKEPRHDVRLLYLAIAHMLKHRGHFLLPGEGFETGDAFETQFTALQDALLQQLDVNIECTDHEALSDILRTPASCSAKKEKLYKFFGIAKLPRPKTDEDMERKLSQDQKSEWLALLAGCAAKTDKLFRDEALADSEVKKIDFKSADMEDTAKLEATLGERMDCLTYAKALYDWAVLADILGGSHFLCQAKVCSYEKHKKDLQNLKAAFRKHLKGEYSAFFRDEQGDKNYIAYIGKSMAKNNRSTCSRNEFLAELKNKLKTFSEDPLVSEILTEIENDTFLPRQSSKDNGGIPYQLQLQELKAILSVQEKHFPFLSQKHADGRTVSEKLCAILSFRIPYYVGPVNDAHKRDGSGFCWVVRKEPGPVRPWNFEEKVDLDASGEAFIRRMTSTCTYLIGAEVLPKDSLLYSRFMVLNELNNLKLNGDKIPVEWKQDIYNDLCASGKRITLAQIKKYLLSAKGINQSDELSGIDGEIKGTLKSERDFRGILGEAFDEAVAEECILTLVLFSDEKRMVRRRLHSRFGEQLSKDQLNRICSLRYSGWGRLSRELLTRIYDADPATGEAISLITALWNTNENLMQLLSSARQFKLRIDEHNAEINGAETEFSYESMVEPLYCSPVVKHGIWRALVIVKELEKVLGHEPERVFVEMAREDGEKKRTVSRLNSLKALYKECGKEAEALAALLETKTEADLRQKKLYLYFTQMGKCMYSGEPITLSELLDPNKYDIDHIYPRSLTKDDSLENLVLVKRNRNREKSDDYPLPENYRQRELWQMLRKSGLIGKTKYDRLMGTSPLTEDQLSGFIARQLVETRQSTKAVAEVLQKLYGKDRIVFVKAGNVSDFRQANELVKVRELNDLHHAKDAYLNIVVGNVYHTKFTTDPRNFIRNAAPRSYSLTKMYDFDVRRGGITAWTAGDSGSIAAVLRTMSGNRILFTRYATEFGAEFYDQMPMKKGHGQIPRKGGDPRFSDLEKYGGYNNDKTAYFFLVRHMVKGKEARTLEYVPVRLADKLRGDKSALLAYCSEELGLQNCELLIPTIKLNTLFNINGFPMHISARTNNNITFKVAAQLVLTEEQTAYLKKVCRFNDRVKAKLATAVTAGDKITAEENISLYKVLLEKHEKTVYRSRPASQVKVLQNGMEKFENLSLEDQCTALGNILVLFKCVFARADLSAIGGSKQAGTVGLNKNLMSASSARIIFQSPTGLFETSVDLLGAFGG